MCPFCVFSQARFLPVREKNIGDENVFFIPVVKNISRNSVFKIV